MSASPSPHSRLVRAILDIDPGRLPRLYQESPEFHAAIETIAAVMHPLIGLLADDAVKAANQRQQAIEALMRQPSTPFTIPTTGDEP